MTCVAVIDVETTGLNPYKQDRIVELAALVVSLDGTLLREFVTLVNPERDIGPTRIHGLTTRDILAAPQFGQVAGALLEALDDCVALAGHNIRFDHSFLSAEFNRLGCPFPDGPTLCTMLLTGGRSLSSACSDHSITAEGEAHSAWHDARATAQLLAALLKSAPRLMSDISRWPPIAWPNVPKCLVRPLTRDDSRRYESEPPTYLQKLLARIQPGMPSCDNSSAIAAYSALLDRALEDRYVDEEEGRDLIELAGRWGISAGQIQKANWDYLLRLGRVALADGVVTDAERRDLHNVASLLGIDSRNLDEILRAAAQQPTDVQPQPSTTAGTLSGMGFAGKQVCFTGECQCRLKGEAITREMASGLAARHGMIFTESVTKKLDLLVVADPLTQSGKAKKARQYRIRIMHEQVFWRALGLEVE
jgi:DNA polymerase III subunit epsilon